MARCEQAIRSDLRVLYRADLDGLDSATYVEWAQQAGWYEGAVRQVRRALAAAEAERRAAVDPLERLKAQMGRRYPGAELRQVSVSEFAAGGGVR